MSNFSSKHRHLQSFQRYISDELYNYSDSVSKEINSCSEGHSAPSRRTDQGLKSKKRRIYGLDSTLDAEQAMVERPIPFKSEITFSNTCRSRLEIENMGWAFEGVQVIAIPFNLLN